MSLSNFLNKSPHRWLQNKRQIDNTDGLWRIHDSLYDVTSFINQHPGGKFWLEETKGTDITEAFESHHIKSEIPEYILKYYYVQEAKHPRTSGFTFHDDGFYKTVKKRARELLKTIPSNSSNISNIYTDCLLVLTLFLAAIANFFSMWSVAFLTGIFGALTIIAAHNYTHMKDNCRMFYGDVFFYPLRDARIAHILSHHMFPNSVADFNMFVAKPYINFFPQQKSFIVKYLSWIYAPLVVFPLALHTIKCLSVVDIVATKQIRAGTAAWLPAVLPVAMHVFGGQSLLDTLVIWQVIIMSTSFFFGMIAVTSNHIHPELYVEGDAPRSKNLDWGISQLDTVSDREEIIGNKFLTLTTFGDHGLHHLFPTLDHSILQYLYPVVVETLRQFNIHDIRIKSQFDLFIGYFKQMARDEPNLIPPNL